MTNNACITPDSLLTLEAYARQRNEFRAQAMARRRERRVDIDEHVSLLFEDELTVRYQIQEMLRAEKIFEPHAIQEEIDTYAPLVSDRHNWKATLLLAWPDEQERDACLHRLAGIEHRFWIQADPVEKVSAVADEDLPRSEEWRTAAVHFLRFEIPDPMCTALLQGARLRMGCDHPAYLRAIEVPPETRTALCRDLVPL